ncbi:septum formation family protein [Arthrobacter sp. TMS1-12-1]
MSNEEQVPRGPGHESGPDETEEPGTAAVVDPDTVILDDGVISAEALEPELTVSPDTLDLEEPALGPARISPEIAEAASLDDAAAEARALAAEAEEAGTLVGGPMPPNAPSVEAAPDVTAPAGGAAGDRADQAAHRTEEAEAGPVGDSADGPVGGAYAFSPEGGGSGAGHPGPYPGSDPGRTGPSAPGDPGDLGRDPGGTGGATRAGWIPTTTDSDASAEGHPKRDRTRAGNSSLPLLLIIGGAAVLLGLLIWLLVSLFGGAGDEARVDPSSLAAGECLAEFTDITEEAVLVDCGEPHNAQLVASENYAEDAAFPGRDQLGLRAEAACAAASAGIDPDVLAGDLQVTLLRATPTERTWADGDRRVDCFAVVEDGGPVRQSLLAR